MENLTGVYLTDDVAKDGTQFPIETLNDIAYHGVSAVPSNVGHDLLRPLGWTVTNRLLITSERSYILGDTWLPETKEECSKFVVDEQTYILGKSIKEASKYKDDITKELKDKGIEVNNRTGRFLYNNITFYEENDIVKKLYPKLFSKTDKDGLLFVNDIQQDFTYMGQGMFKDNSSQLAIMLHPFFRRSYYILNNYNIPFLNEFFSLLCNKDINLRVRIDLNRIGYEPSFKSALEYEYWYGPKYNDDISSIPLGNTVYGYNPEKEKTQKYFNQVERTDFVFSKQKDDIIFEMEEVTDEESKAIGKDLYGCRYLHSIYKEDGIFEHFDGAIRVYDFEKIMKRVSTDMNKMGHNTDYTKIFRMDGKIPLHTWKLLITLYLNGNPYVYDYFGIRKEADNIMYNKVQESDSKLFPEISSNSGIALYVSYHLNNMNFGSDVALSSYDEASFEETRIKCIDSMTMDLVKSIGRGGLKIEIPNDLEMYDVQDNIHNIPTICLQKPNQGDMNAIIGGIKILLQNIKGEQIYSFSINWPIDSRRIQLCFAGSATVLKTWLYKAGTIPVNFNDLKLGLAYNIII